MGLELWGLGLRVWDVVWRLGRFGVFKALGFGGVMFGVLGLNIRAQSWALGPFPFWMWGLGRVGV